MKNTQNPRLRTGTPIDEADIVLCRTLWLAVAVQAMIDATSNSRKTRLVNARNEALQWFVQSTDESSDFAMVCDLACVNVGKLKKKFREVFRNPDTCVDFRCLKKEKARNRGIESRIRYMARVRKNRLLREERAKKIRELKYSAPVSVPTQLGVLQKDDFLEIKHAS